MLSPKEELQSCPSCGNCVWGYENGKIVCAVCGYIMERNEEKGKTCIHCLNSEPYVCDIIWCSEHKKPTHKQETCEKFRRSL